MRNRKQDKSNRPLAALRHKQSPLSSSKNTVYDTSLLNMKIEVLEQEYQVLWAEINSRIASQHQIVSYSLTILAASIAAGQALLVSPATQFTFVSLRPVYPAFSMIFCGFVLMISHHNSMIAYLATYIEQELRPNIEKILSDGGTPIRIWNWNRWRIQAQFSKFPTNFLEFGIANAGYAVVFAPSIFFLVLYGLALETAFPPPSWEIALFLLSLVMIVLAITVGFYVRILFARLGQEY